ncbi:MAG: transcriptional regulator, partial [Chloroflexales bacterium]
MTIGCGEVQGMLDAGLRPGAHERRLVELGFHMAGCAACRAYCDQLDTALLGALLGVPLEPPAALVRPARRWPRYAAIVAAALLVGGLGFVFSRVAYAAYTISQNIAAM